MNRMLPRRFSHSILFMLFATTIGAGTGAQSTPPAATHDVTIKGNVLCNRATDTVPWSWDPKDGDHTPVIYALEGTPAIDEELRKILEIYPDHGLDADRALDIQERFTKRLKYFIEPGPLTDQIHKDVEAGSRLLALNGTISEKDGKRWIKVTKSEPSQLKYPEKIIASDRPFKAQGKDPLVLKIGEALTLKCVLLPPGRFVQGSPFYQRRYQDEYPHEVTLTKAFYMSEIPVTQEMFNAVMHRLPAPSEGMLLPAEQVPLADIEEFCRLVSRQSGVVVRLPTDAEWEYAARVGTSNPCFPEKYKDQISETGGKPNTTPVGTKKPNAWGLYDMLCSGWHVTGDYKADNVRIAQVDPRGPAATDREVHRDATGKLHKTRGGRHYDHLRPNIHGAATVNGTLWESGAQIFRVVVETGSTTNPGSGGAAP
jgi:hypothetical protein